MSDCHNKQYTLPHQKPYGFPEETMYNAAPILQLCILFIMYLFSYPVMSTTPNTSLIPTSPSEDTQTSGTDLEEINTEDERNTDTSKWSDKERKKLQHMKEFHEEYQRVFGDKASLCTITRKGIAHMNPSFHIHYVRKKCKMLILILMKSL